MKFGKVFFILTIFFLYINFVNINCERVYDIHLENEPIKRWTEVATDEIWNIQQLESNLAEVVPLFFLKLAEKLAEYLQKILIPSNYLEELQGIQNATNVSMGLLIISNIFYDVNPHCTSIVAQGTDGLIWHARNLDYDLTHFLENSTIVINFKRNNKTVYRGVTFAGIIGLLTAEKNGIFTISLDERDTADYWFVSFYKTLVAILTRDFKISSFAIRDSLETHNLYEEAVSYLTDVQLIAPCYYIIAGAHPGQGAVITRDRSRAVDVWKLSSVDERWFLVETNFDHWKYPIDERRKKAIDTLQLIGQNNLNSTNLLQLLSTAPVHNSGTVYSILMSAKDENIWNIHIW